MKSFLFGGARTSSSRGDVSCLKGGQIPKKLSPPWQLKPSPQRRRLRRRRRWPKGKQRSVHAGAKGRTKLVRHGFVRTKIICQVQNKSGLLFVRTNNKPCSNKKQTLSFCWTKSLFCPIQIVRTKTNMSNLFCYLFEQNRLLDKFVRWFCFVPHKFVR